MNLALSRIWLVMAGSLLGNLRLDVHAMISCTFTGGGEESSLYARLGAALTTSAIGISVANPSDVVKIRQQACNISDLARKWLLSCTQPAVSCKSIPCAGVTLRSASILSFQPVFAAGLIRHHTGSAIGKGD